MKRIALSLPEKLVRVNATAIRKPLSKAQNAEIDRLLAMPDSEIDFSDVPDTVGTVYKPLKRPITIRIDADVLAWLKSSPGYQTRVNKMLRQAMKAARSR